MPATAGSAAAGSVSCSQLVLPVRSSRPSHGRRERRAVPAHSARRRSRRAPARSPPCRAARRSCRFDSEPHAARPWRRNFPTRSRSRARRRIARASAAAARVPSGVATPATSTASASTTMRPSPAAANSSVREARVTTRRSQVGSKTDVQLGRAASPGRTSSGHATSTRIGPIGENQRAPIPAPTRASKSPPRNALPASAKIATDQSLRTGCSYSRLASRSRLPPISSPAALRGPSDS